MVDEGLAASDIIGHHLRHRELVDLENRIETIEEQIGSEKEPMKGQKPPHYLSALLMTP